MKHAVLTVFGKDRPGIIAKVTELLFRQGCNLEDISMTILEGEFAMMMIVCLSEKKAKSIQADLAQAAKSSGLSFFWKEFKEKPQRGEKHLKGTEPHVLTVMGQDRTGIVYQTSRLLAGLGLNITDLNSKILGRGRKAVYAMMLEVDIPKKFDFKKLQRSVTQLAQKLHVECRIKPVERLSF